MKEATLPDLPQLCGPDVCTACGACSSVCPKSAISMVEDKRGFLQPVIDPDKCVHCRLCEHSCPVMNLNTPKERTPDVYACWHRDETVRALSSSGGAFSAIAQYVLDRGGLVWGAAYDARLKLSYQCVDNSADLDRLRRSKYYQCEVGNAFKQIAEQLKFGKLILFCGTSCHVNGLYAYLGNRYLSHLLTIDLVCHGVASPGVFQKYVCWLNSKYKDVLLDFNFRDKSTCSGYDVAVTGRFSTAGKKILKNVDNSYVYGMLHNLYLRDCCHHCQFNGVERISDFTIADFWGIGREVSYKYTNDLHKGISMLACNSEKAKATFLDGVLSYLCFEKRTLEEAVVGNGNYCHSSRKSSRSSDFWKDFEADSSWDYLIQQYLHPNIKEQCKFMLKSVTPPRQFNILKNVCFQIKKLISHG
jgi:ferredoxin